MSTPSIKRSFTIRPEVDVALQSFENKSEVVNAALSVYFERTGYLKKAEEAFWDSKIKAGLLDIKEGRVTAINPNNEKITKKQLGEVLWS